MKPAQVLFKVLQDDPMKALYTVYIVRQNFRAPEISREEDVPVISFTRFRITSVAGPQNAVTAQGRLFVRGFSAQADEYYMDMNIYELDRVFETLMFGKQNFVPNGNAVSLKL